MKRNHQDSSGEEDSDQNSKEENACALDEKFYAGNDPQKNRPQENSSDQEESGLPGTDHHGKVLDKFNSIQESTPQQFSVTDTDDSSSELGEDHNFPNLSGKRNLEKIQTHKDDQMQGEWQLENWDGEVEINPKTVHSENSSNN